MMQEAFTIAAQKAQSGVFDFNDEVADFYRHHPDQKDKTFFIEATVSGSRLICEGLKDEEKIREILKDDDDLELLATRVWQSGEFCAVVYENHNCVFVTSNGRGGTTDILGPALTFDHETGHLVCPEGWSDNFHLSECVADAHAALRHFQRFGKESAAINKLVGVRAAGLVFSRDNGNHFTCPVIEKIIADKEKIDFSTLTPMETTNMARDYASACAVCPKSLNKAFSSFKGRFSEMIKGDFAVLKELGNFVLATQDPGVFKWGAAAVYAILDEQITFTSARLPKEKEWEQLRQAIDKRQAGLDFQYKKSSALNT